jgi:hypothetical protein
LLLEMRDPAQALAAFQRAREMAPEVPQHVIGCAQAHTALKAFDQVDELCTVALSLLGFVGTGEGPEPEPEPEPGPEPEPRPEPKPEPELEAYPESKQKAQKDAAQTKANEQRTTKTTAETLCLRGNARLELGQRSEAESDYHAAVKCDAQCAMAHHCIGSALAVEGQHLDTAIRELHLAVEMQPSLLVAHFTLAGVHMQLEEFDMAVACLTSCIENAGDDPQKLCVRTNSSVECKQRMLTLCAGNGVELSRTANEAWPIHALSSRNLEQRCLTTPRR